jgi:YD repeat-containing protein
LSHGDGRQYTYTSFDLPRSITTPAGTTLFKYDALGSRVSKQGPGGVTTSIRDLYESREGPGGFTHTFVVHSADGPVAEIVYKPAEPNPRTVHYRHHDALGSVSVTTSQSGPPNRRYFEPFGGHVGFDGTPAATLTHDIRHGFTGHPHDDDLGLIDMRPLARNGSRDRRDCAPACAGCECALLIASLSPNGTGGRPRIRGHSTQTGSSSGESNEGASVDAVGNGKSVVS